MHNAIEMLHLLHEFRWKLCTISTHSSAQSSRKFFRFTQSASDGFDYFKKLEFIKRRGKKFWVHIKLNTYEHSYLSSVPRDLHEANLKEEKNAIKSLEFSRNALIGWKTETRFAVALRREISWDLKMTSSAMETICRHTREISRSFDFFNDG